MARITNGGGGGEDDSGGGSSSGTTSDEQAVSQRKQVSRDTSTTESTASSTSDGSDSTADRQAVESRKQREREQSQTKAQQDDSDGAEQASSGRSPQGSEAGDRPSHRESGRSADRQAVRQRQRQQRQSGESPGDAGDDSRGRYDPYAGAAAGSDVVRDGEPGTTAQRNRRQAERADDLAVDVGADTRDDDGVQYDPYEGAQTGSDVIVRTAEGDYAGIQARRNELEAKSGPGIDPSEGGDQRLQYEASSRAQLRERMTDEFGSGWADRFDIVETEDGAAAVPKEQADIDWSFGLGDPDPQTDEVEAWLRREEDEFASAFKSFAEEGGNIGPYEFGGFGDTLWGKTLKGATEGVGTYANPAGLALTALEGVETGVDYKRDEFAELTGGRSEQFLESTGVQEYLGGDPLTREELGAQTVEVASAAPGAIYRSVRDDPAGAFGSGLALAATAGASGLAASKARGVVRGARASRLTRRPSVVDDVVSRERTKIGQLAEDARAQGSLVGKGKRRRKTDDLGDSLERYRRRVREEAAQKRKVREARDKRLRDKRRAKDESRKDVSSPGRKEIPDAVGDPNYQPPAMTPKSGPSSLPVYPESQVVDFRWIDEFQEVAPTKDLRQMVDVGVDEAAASSTVAGAGAPPASAAGSVANPTEDVIERVEEASRIEVLEPVRTPQDVEEDTTIQAVEDPVMAGELQGTLDQEGLAATPEEVSEQVNQPTGTAPPRADEGADSKTGQGGRSDVGPGSRPTPPVVSPGQDTPQKETQYTYQAPSKATPTAPNPDPPTYQPGQGTPGRPGRPYGPGPDLPPGSGGPGGRQGFGFDSPVEFVNPIASASDVLGLGGGIGGKDQPVGGYADENVDGRASKRDDDELGDLPNGDAFEMETGLEPAPTAKRKSTDNGLGGVDISGDPDDLDGR